MAMSFPFNANLSPSCTVCTSRRRRAPLRPLRRRRSYPRPLPVPRSCCRTLAGCRLSSSSVTSASRATCDPRCLTHASTRECHGACRFGHRSCSRKPRRVGPRVRAKHCQDPPSCHVQEVRIDGGIACGAAKIPTSSCSDPGQVVMVARDGPRGPMVLEGRASSCQPEGRRPRVLPNGLGRFTCRPSSSRIPACRGRVRTRAFLQPESRRALCHCQRGERQHGRGACGLRAVGSTAPSRPEPPSRDSALQATPLRRGYWWAPPAGSTA